MLLIKVFSWMVTYLVFVEGIDRNPKLEYDYSLKRQRLEAEEEKFKGNNIQLTNVSIII